MRMMVRTQKKLIAVFAAVAASASNSAHADVQNFTDAQRPLWFDAVAQMGDYLTVTFSDLPAGTVVTDQYQNAFGTTFTDGNDRVHFSPSAYPNDSFGLDGFLSANIVFNEPQNWFATDHPDALIIRLYSNDVLFYTSNISGANGIADFNGVISDVPFDKVQIFDPEDSNVNMDDMYFGALPAPSTFLIVTGFLYMRHNGRRRTETI